MITVTVDDLLTKQDLSLISGRIDMQGLKCGTRGGHWCRCSTGWRAGGQAGDGRPFRGREGPHTKREREKNNSNSKMAQSRVLLPRSLANNADIAAGDVFTG